MIEYLAKYTINAYMFDGGAWMPDPQQHNIEYNFKAVNDKEAIKKAKEHMKTFKDEFFGPRASLDQLLRVEAIQI